MMSSSYRLKLQMKCRSTKQMSHSVDIDGWINDEEMQTNFLNSWRVHNLVNPKYIDIHFFCENECLFQEQFSYQGLKQFIQMRVKKDEEDISPPISIDTSTSQPKTPFEHGVMKYMATLSRSVKQLDVKVTKLLKYHKIDDEDAEANPDKAINDIDHVDTDQDEATNEDDTPDEEADDMDTTAATTNDDEDSTQDEMFD
ncbi:hypothetical protein DEO72_LG5g2566 [Vigna unguiculata]|uniref:Uncharacterized protein n=1 Tax=Vigna unguiculata TaxID=3917 RepID=A0A4D6M032_VIGUN|nr:hypothetical protein DEO72_LG5g2566 [Vigna unguiculata]